MADMLREVAALPSAAAAGGCPYLAAQRQQAASRPAAVPFKHAAVNVDALRSEIRLALINQKANACPIAMRMAWHAAGTYDKRDGTGGCNGATMRFAPESNDPDNAGLSIIRDLLLPVKRAHPEISHADLYAVAACCAIEFLGGPRVPVRFGRSDDANGARCPANGRLPDAKKGAKHLRDVFGRMGFDDGEIVALSGAHTLGRAHAARSGFDGPWTTKPLQFDNEYFVNLLHRTWKLREWDGPLQFEDEESGTLMMLPSDLALVEDPAMKKFVEVYAADQNAFFNDFAKAYAKLLALGCPAECDPFRAAPAGGASQPAHAAATVEREAKFREYAMHGSVYAARKVAKEGPLNVDSLEPTSGRTALHKAAFWGHNDMTQFLLKECGVSINVQDCYGDSALHDAAKFGHEGVLSLLIDNGADRNLRNVAGHTPLDIAKIHSKEACVRRLTNNKL